MAATPLQLAKRAFVKVLLELASQYCVSLQLTRDSPDAHLLPAFRRVVKKVHPDKGGREEDAKKLHSAKDNWEAAARP